MKLSFLLIAILMIPCSVNAGGMIRCWTAKEGNEITRFGIPGAGEMPKLPPLFEAYPIQAEKYKLSDGAFDLIAHDLELDTSLVRVRMKLHFDKKTKNYSGKCLIDSGGTQRMIDEDDCVCEITDQKSLDAEDNNTIPKADRETAITLIKALKAGDKQRIAHLIDYPLERITPLLPILNETQFVSSFDQFYDSAVLKNIDLWEGSLEHEENGITQIGKGNTFIHDGKIYSITGTDQQSSIAKKEPIEPGDPLFECLTLQHRIRIQKIKNSLHYLSWKRNQSVTEKPEIDLVGKKESNQKISIHDPYEPFDSKIRITLMWSTKRSNPLPPNLWAVHFSRSLRELHKSVRKSAMVLLINLIVLDRNCESHA